MNESIAGSEKGLEFRVFQLRPAEVKKLSEFITDKTIKEYVAQHSYAPPRVQAVDILDMEIEAQDSEALPARLIVVLARGHRDLAEFVVEHTGWEHNVSVYETEEEVVKAECYECHEQMTLTKKSLVGNPLWRQEPFL